MKKRTTTFFKCKSCDHVAEWLHMRKLLGKSGWKTILACPLCGSIDTKRVYDGPSKAELRVL